jgi:acyl-CoA synthetase (AMP-forming)/AMP-acid ligase II
MVLGDILISNACRYPNKLALVDGENRYSWKTLNERANRLANGLTELGMRKGDRIAILADNCHHYVELLFATAKLGLIAVCLNYRLSGEQLCRMIRITEPVAIIIRDRYQEAIEAIRGELPFMHTYIRFGSTDKCAVDYESLVSGSSDGEPTSEVNEDDAYAICFSSGTTGEPKAAVVSHKNRIANANQIAVAHAATRENTMLLTLALYTSATQQFLFTYAFVGATQIVINFSPQDFLEAIENEKADTVMINFTLCNLIKEYVAKRTRDYDLSSIELLRSAGQALSYEQWREVVEFFHNPLIIKGLALTEAGLATSGIPEEYKAWLSPQASAEEKKKFGSLGKPMLGVQMRVVDENDQDVPTGEVGEFILKGDNVVRSFWNQPHVTEQTLRGGWLHTGDLAMIDEDGYMYLMGRKDDRIRTGGLNVYPVEIEEVLARHAAVGEVAVFGIPDEHWGERIMAAAILKEGKEATEDELKEYCRKHMARYEVPKKFFFVKDFPRHPVWKRVQKKELAQELCGTRKEEGASL